MTYKDDTVSVGDWLIMMILLCIPFVNFILLLVWAFGDNTKPSKVNFAKASLLWGLMVAIFFIGFFCK